MDGYFRLINFYDQQHANTLFKLIYNVSILILNIICYNTSWCHLQETQKGSLNNVCSLLLLYGYMDDMSCYEWFELKS